jgi:ankyrin repeat protein
MYILGDIVVLLRYIDDNKGRLSGIIYLHRITDNRVSGSTGRNFQILRKLCGDGFLRRVCLVTTMWERLDDFEAHQRQEQLEKSFWKDMIDKGAVPCRYRGTTDSALRIINILFRRPISEDTIPDIQRESLKENRPLLELSAGRVIYEDIEQKLQQCDSSIATIKEEHLELEQGMNSASEREVSRELKREIDRLMEERRQLGGLLKGRATEGLPPTIVTKGDHSPGQEAQTVSERRRTLSMEESAPEGRSISGQPRNAPERDEAGGPESIWQTSSTKDGSQLPEKQLLRKGLFPEAGMAAPQTMDYGSNAEYSKHTSYEPTLLYQAVDNGDEAMVRRLVEDNKEDINAKAVNGGTVLHWAVENGHEKMVRLLIGMGADVTAKTDDGTTALHQAGRKGRAEMAGVLVEKGADINAETANGETALLCAVGNGHEKMALLLIAMGADVTKKTDNGMTALHQAGRNGHATLVDLLVRKGANVNAETADGETALLWAAENGHAALVDLLARKGADINAKSANRETALLLAVENGHEKTARLLIEEGADVKMKTDNGTTVLHWAVEERRVAVAQLLLERRADVNADTVTGMTALHQTGRNGHDEMAQLLMKNRADTNAKTTNGGTALHWAVSNGHQRVVKLLLENDSSINAKDMNGRTALHRAAEKGQQAMVSLLLERNAEPDARDKDERTALWEAAKNGHREVVLLLLKKRADMSAIPGLEEMVQRLLRGQEKVPFGAAAD